MNNFDISYFLTNSFIEPFILLIVSVLIAILLLLLSFLIIYQKPDSEKLAVYECGYDPYENTRHNFNINFYLIAIFFLIFDIEILFVLPWSINFINLTFLSFWSMIDFLIELSVGYFYIYYNNCLIWK